MQHPPVVVRNLTVPLDRGISISKPLRIAHVSDLHLRRLCATTRAAQQTLLAMGIGASVGAAYAGFVHLIALWLPVNLLGLALAWKQNLSIRQLAGTGDIPVPEAERIGQPLEDRP